MGFDFFQIQLFLQILLAAVLWATAAIGIAVGAQLYFLAISATLLIIILTVFKLVEDKFFLQSS